MNIIIDTHIFLWALAEPFKIDAVKREALEDIANTIYVSSVTIAEIMIKASLGKLQIDFDPVEITQESGFALLDFSCRAASLLKDMPFHHKDPFDRMLIAQCLSENYLFMSDDSKMQLYGCKII